MTATRVERARPWLGTVVVVRVDAPADIAMRAVEAGFAAVEAVHRSMSFHAPESDLARVNRLAAREPQPVPPMFARVLRAALALARASGGRFDPTIAARLVESGHLPRPDATIPDPAASWRDVAIDSAGRVHFRRALWLDFGGIAKGHAVDCAVRAMRAAGATAGLVNAGGDLRVFGDMPETLRVRDPRGPSRTRELATVRDGAIATSAGYFSQCTTGSALRDGRDGRAVAPSRSVSVSAPRAIWADALTKVVLADEDASIPLLRKLHGRAARLDAAGDIRILP